MKLNCTSVAVCCRRRNRLYRQKRANPQFHHSNSDLPICNYTLVAHDDFILSPVILSNSVIQFWHGNRSRLLLVSEQCCQIPLILYFLHNRMSKKIQIGQRAKDVGSRINRQINVPVLSVSGKKWLKVLINRAVSGSLKWSELADKQSGRWVGVWMGGCRAPKPSGPCSPREKRGCGTKWNVVSESLKKNSPKKICLEYVFLKPRTPVSGNGVDRCWWYTGNRVKTYSFRQYVSLWITNTIGWKKQYLAFESFNLSKYSFIF